MAKTSINIQPCKVAQSERHNERRWELTEDQKMRSKVREELSPNNERAIYDNRPLSQILEDIKNTYKASKGKKMHAKATPLREGVVVIKEDTTLEDLKRFTDEVQRRWGPRCVQAYIHKDEGHWAWDKENDWWGAWKPNYHAHLVFDWTDTHGVTYKLDKLAMQKMQTLLAETLGMERGESSEREHLNATQYANQQEMKNAKELQQLNEAVGKEVLSGLTKLKELTESNKTLEATNTTLERENREKQANLSQIEVDVEKAEIRLEQTQERIEDEEGKERESKKRREDADKRAKEAENRAKETEIAVREHERKNWEKAQKGFVSTIANLLDPQTRKRDTLKSEITTLTEKEKALNLSIIQRSLYNDFLEKQGKEIENKIDPGKIIKNASNVLSNIPKEVRVKEVLIPQEDTLYRLQELMPEYSDVSDWMNILLQVETLGVPVDEVRFERGFHHNFVYNVGTEKVSAEMEIDNDKEGKIRLWIRDSFQNEWQHVLQWVKNIVEVIKEKARRSIEQTKESAQEIIATRQERRKLIFKDPKESAREKLTPEQRKKLEEIENGTNPDFAKWQEEHYQTGIKPKPRGRGLKP